ncbi:flavodoxin [Chengkuizengella axinellae]|uniref:Flavodoxin n=1 Tax=Chengkuizengella axinellae TaxID=3064388 RepID=A0ABT9J121_9BACL|nr:flavodoxin [Chengkuizengella sp. 2205SS18-9]MDP5275319.1 flavodoxin [Chengkuizengella sp. 2205SS18-9]
MTKIIMIYASMSGNTEEMAEKIEEVIKEQDISLEVKMVDDANTSDLLDYDGIILGSYTWGDGELPDEFLDFYDEMDELNLDHKIGAVFGSCDSSYPEYGAAVDILTNKLKELGTSIAVKGLKVDGMPDEQSFEECTDFANQFLQQLLNFQK